MINLITMKISGLLFLFLSIIFLIGFFLERPSKNAIKDIIIGLILLLAALFYLFI